MNTATEPRLSAPLAQAADESFWRALHPDLHISPFPLAAKLAGASPISGPVAERSAQRMIKDGYFDTPPIMSQARAARLAVVIGDLAARGIAPVFAFVYDEFWQMACGMSPVLASLLGEDFQMTPSDIWAWHVTPSSTAAGWGPHRDMFAGEAVREDGRPRVVNVWIPLTDATPLNSCMYVLPMRHDGNIPGNLEEAPSFGNFMAIQNIRAVPAAAGSALGWNTHVMHWGGRSTEWAEQPRISVAIFFHSRDCRLNDIDYDRAREGFASQDFGHRFEMPFASRLRAIAGAICLYHQKVRIDFPHDWQDLYAFSEKYIGAWSGSTAGS